MADEGSITKWLNKDSESFLINLPFIFENVEIMSKLIDNNIDSTYKFFVLTWDLEYVTLYIDSVEIVRFKK